MITKTWHAELKSHGVKSPVVSDVKPELGAGGRGDRRKNPVDKERKEGRRCAERSKLMELQGIQDTECKHADQS